MNQVFERLGGLDAKVDAIHGKIDALSPGIKDHERRIRTLEAAYHKMKVVWIAGAALVGAVAHAIVDMAMQGGKHVQGPQ